MQLADVVLGLLRKAGPNGLTRDEIADELDVEETKVQRALKELERSGSVRKAPELKTTRENVYVLKRIGRG